MNAEIVPYDGSPQNTQLLDAEPDVARWLNEREAEAHQAAERAWCDTLNGLPIANTKRGQLISAARCYQDAARDLESTLACYFDRQRAAAEERAAGDERRADTHERIGVIGLHDPLGKTYGRTDDGRLKLPAKGWPWDLPAALWCPHETDPVANLRRAQELLAAEITRLQALPHA